MANNQNIQNERPIENQIKNLQVSISIAKKEITEKVALLKNCKQDEKEKYITRLAQLDKIIEKKELELKPLLEKRGKSGNRSKIQVSEDDKISAMKKYGISL